MNQRVAKKQLKALGHWPRVPGRAVIVYTAIAVVRTWDRPYRKAFDRAYRRWSGGTSCFDVRVYGAA